MQQSNCTKFFTYQLLGYYRAQQVLGVYFQVICAQNECFSDTTNNYLFNSLAYLQIFSNHQVWESGTNKCLAFWLKNDKHNDSIIQIVVSLSPVNIIINQITLQICSLDLVTYIPEFIHCEHKLSTT